MIVFSTFSYVIKSYYNYFLEVFYCNDINCAIVKAMHTQNRLCSKCLNTQTATSILHKVGGVFKLIWSLMNIETCFSVVLENNVVYACVSFL